VKRFRRWLVTGVVAMLVAAKLLQRAAAIPEPGR
jgi:hypothetical protein